MVYKDIPLPTDNLSNSQGDIRGNFQQIDTTFGVDHVTYSVATVSNGYHKTIHLKDNSTIATPMPNPTPVAGTGEIFTNQVNDLISTDETFYFQTGSGKLLQMTRNFVPQVSTNGYTFLPGGLILQWGQYVTPGSVNLPANGSISFATEGVLNFPSNNFNVNLSFTGNSGSGQSIQVITATLTGFTWRFSGGSTNSYSGFFWTAIGR